MIIIGSTDLKTRDRFLAEEMQLQYEVNSLNFNLLAPALGIASSIWGGVFEVEPGSRTGIHHHGEQETIAYVLSGTCEIRWGARGEFVARAKVGDFIHVPAFLLHMEINP